FPLDLLLFSAQIAGPFPQIKEEEQGPCAGAHKDYWRGERQSRAKPVLKEQDRSGQCCRAKPCRPQDTPYPQTPASRGQSSHARFEQLIICHRRKSLIVSQTPVAL